LVVGAAVLAVVTAGCSSGAPASAPQNPSASLTPARAPGPAAEPGVAPAPTVPPAGRVIPLPAQSAPWGIVAAPATGQVFVSLRDPGGLGVLDTRTNTVRVVNTPDGAEARHLEVAGPGGPLLLPAENTDTLYTLGLPALGLQAPARTGRSAHDAVQVADRIFVTDEFGHQVSVLQGGRTIATLDQPVQPGGINAAGGRVAVADVATATLWVYDAATLQPLAALPAGDGPSHVKPLGGSRVAVVDVSGDAVLTYDLAGTPHQIGRVPVPGRAFGLDTDPATGTIYAVLSNTNQIAEITTDPAGTPTLVATLPTVRQPNSVALDPATGTVYVAGNVDPHLQILPTTAFTPR
jgi:DNA-binding beta-propeller fold protein YncE